MARIQANWRPIGESMTAESLSSALGGRRVGSQYIAKCPAHDDRTPSLSLAERHGRVLVKCFAGCAQRDVINALKERGVWESDAPSFEQRIVCAYTYTDETRNPLYEIVRLHSPKDFRQRYSDGRGGWIWKKHPRQVLYRLPEVTEASIVFLPEGEKDVETLRSHGFTATCEAGGCNSPWLDSFSEALTGREVNIIPDNDGPGWDRAKRIARALLVRAARIRLLDLPQGVKDISEWFERGHSECELISMLEGVHAV